MATLRELITDPEVKAGEFIRQWQEKNEGDRGTVDAGTGNTLLHLAVRRGKYQIIEFLLNQEAEINVLTQNNQGDTALHLAAQLGRFKLISMLAKKTDKKGPGKSNPILIVKNHKNQTPLHMAAAFTKNDKAYNEFLSLDGGLYSKEDLDEIKSIRKKQLPKKNLKAFLTSLFESFCPASSLSDIAESFVFIGLTVGAGASIALGLSAAFVGVAVFGLGLITLANYKKNQADKLINSEFEDAKINALYYENLGKRLKMHHAQGAEQILIDAEEYEQIKTLLKPNQEGIKKSKGFSFKGEADSVVAYTHRSDKVFSIIGALGSFICTYSGLVGFIGLGLGMTAAVMGVSVGGLLVAAGPIGIAVCLGVGLALAAGLAIYHFKKIKQDYAIIGELRSEISDYRKTAYEAIQKLKKDDGIQQLLNAPEVAAVPLVDNLGNEEGEGIDPSPAQLKQESKPRSDNHGHPLDKVCSLEVKAATQVGFLATPSPRNTAVQALTDPIPRRKPN